MTIDGHLDLEDEYYIEPAELTKADVLEAGHRYSTGETAAGIDVGEDCLL